MNSLHKRKKGNKKTIMKESSVRTIRRFGYIPFFIHFLMMGIALAPHFTNAQEKVYPGADERSPSRSEYFSWINNTNEGPTEQQTLTNLEFFKWLQDEYGMTLDIYAFDAGAIDGKRFYGSINSDRFKSQFPRGFDPIYQKAKSMNTRLGVWGGPDGFGETEAEKNQRIAEMVSLCRDFEFSLFKFDAVCGPLRPEKEDAFIEMMKQSRKYSPDLILLNHRLGLNKGEPYATTFLWGGKETYIDVFMTNTGTATHHRAGALERGLSPDLKRLTEDHGVCISSCIDFWDDDLILQGFNRNLILSPQIYGNPWLMRDDEFPKLARIFNLHRRYREIMIDALILPEEKYGPSALSRGDQSTRLVTLRNLGWERATYKVKLGGEIGLSGEEKIEVRQFHPVEKVIGRFNPGSEIAVEVEPFRSCLIIASNKPIDEPGIAGSAYQIIKNVDGKPVEISVLGMPGTKTKISLSDDSGFKSATLDGKPAQRLINGGSMVVQFGGEPLKNDYHRKLGDLQPVTTPDDAQPLYEATVFAADNNALEVRSLIRSGDTKIPQVQAARDAFFNQAAFIERGIWDRNLFDGNIETAFWPSFRYNSDIRIDRGCFRLDMGEAMEVDQIILKVPDVFSLQPLLVDEGNYAEVSEDLVHWRRITFLAGKESVIPVNGRMRYLRINPYPTRIAEVEAIHNGKPLARSQWRASNMFAGSLQPQKTWKAEFMLDEIPAGSYLCIALNGEHGEEGAYAAAKIDGKYFGCPDRAVSYISNPWETRNARRSSNYTYYLPLTKEMVNKKIEVYAMGYQEDRLDFKPEVWITSSAPYEEKRLILNK